MTDKTVLDEIDRMIEQGLREQSIPKVNLVSPATLARSSNEPTKDIPAEPLPRKAETLTLVSSDAPTWVSRPHMRFPFIRKTN